MSENPCEHIIKEANKAAHEWVLWEKRATFPPRHLKLDEVKQPINLTPEQQERLREAKEKARVAEEKYHKAWQAMNDCVKKHIK